MTTVNRIDRLQGMAFQSFCDVLLSASDPGFHAVDGAGGDGGNDGFSVAGDTLFQAYGPDVRSLAKIKVKVDDSIAKATRLRRSTLPLLRKFVFLTPFDLTVDQHNHLRTAAAAANLTCESWGESRLLALLALHPEVKNEFPEFLLPDLLQELRKLRVGATALPKREEPIDDDALGEIEVTHGEDLPWIDVWQKVPEHPDQSCAAYAYFKVYVVAASLALPSIEPEDEDQFLAAVHERFWDAKYARLEMRDHVHVLVEHGLPDLSFHRRWGRWTSGIVAMASTLPDLHRPGFYSVADMACDVTIALRLAAQLGISGPARVVFGYDPSTLEARFDPSDVRARDGLDAKLRGVHVVGRPVLKETRESTWGGEFELARLASDAHTIAAALIVPAIRFFHHARIDTKDFASSIPDLIAADLDAQRL